MSNGHRVRLVLSILETDATFRREQVRGEELWVGRCIFCNAKLAVPLSGEADRRVTVEHIVPRHHGGTDDPENLALACARCNGEKGRRHDNRDRNDERRIEVTRALLERRKERWPAGARAPVWPLVDEHGPRPAPPPAPDEAPRAAALRLSQLFVYPIKSAAGIALPEAEVTDRGLAHDRRFLVVDDNGRFLTQREQPKMALLRPSLQGDKLRCEGPERPPLEVPLRPEGGRRVQVFVWGDLVEALEVDDGGWFAAALGARCRLVYMPDDAVRLVDSDYAQHGEMVSFADEFPFLLLSQASIDQLGERLGETLSVRRFRPNFVVEGCEPGAEDDWRRVRIGDVPFSLAKACTRCQIVNIDPDTGSPGKEPLAALAGYRKQGQKIKFGQLLLAQGEGRVRVGDRVEVLSRGPS